MSLEHLASFPTFDFCQYWSRVVNLLVLNVPFVPGHFELHCMVILLEPELLMFHLAFRHLVEPLHCCQVRELSDDVVALLLRMRSGDMAERSWV